jgi:hypothetical protein
MPLLGAATDSDGATIKTRTYHFLEADYLATLAALCRVEGWDEDAAKIVAIRPLPKVELLRKAIMNEADYSRILNEARICAATACQDLAEALAQWKSTHGA